MPGPALAEVLADQRVSFPSHDSFHTTGFVSLDGSSCFTTGVTGTTLGGRGVFDAMFSLPEMWSARRLGPAGDRPSCRFV